MKATLLIFVALLAACSSTSNTGPVADGGVNGDSASDMSSYSGPVTQGPPGCGVATDTYIYALPDDGGTFKVEVVIPCDPNYIDKGDPAPEQVSRDHSAVNPSPVVGAGIAE